jgi:hypothetical protein
MSSDPVRMTVNDREMFGRVARVESVTLGTEGHGILTVWLMLDYGGSGQGFGGYALDEWHEPWGRRRGTAYGTDYLLRLLAAFGVDSLDKIKGRYCYALTDDDGWNSTLRGIAPMPMDDGKPFLVTDLLADWGIDKK